jgi:hypothetical protein
MVPCTEDMALNVRNIRDRLYLYFSWAHNVLITTLLKPLNLRSQHVKTKTPKNLEAPQTRIHDCISIHSE